MKGVIEEDESAKQEGGGRKQSGPLPVDEQCADGHSGELVEHYEFHGGGGPLPGQAALADVAGPTTTLRGNDFWQNSTTHSRAEGVETGGNSGLGRDAAYSLVPAQGAEDHGTAVGMEERSRESQGSGCKLVQSKVSPSSFRQVMSLARSKLHEVGSERMQNSAEDPSSTSEDFFPLPLPRQPGTKSDLACADMVYGLNMLACRRGEGPPPKREPQGIVENLGKLCDRFKVWDEVLEPLDFRDFFAKRGVTYDGEEVRVAQTLTWEGVRSSLPDEVGRLDLRDFCTQGTLYYIDHFEDHVMDTTNLSCPRAPRVMVGDDWPAICEGLITKKICEVIPADQLFHIDQVPLLNGMFGVGKGEYVDNIETQRLITKGSPLGDTLSLSCEASVGTSGSNN